MSVVRDRTSNMVWVTLPCAAIGRFIDMVSERWERPSEEDLIRCAVIRPLRTVELVPEPTHEDYMPYIALLYYPCWILAVIDSNGKRRAYIYKWCRDT